MTKDEILVALDEDQATSMPAAAVRSLLDVPATVHTHTVGQITNAGTMASQNDAPNDNREYVRKNNLWVEKTGGDPAVSIHAATTKDTPADEDELGFVSSVGGWVLRKLTFAQFKTWLNGIYALAGHAHTGTYEPANANIQSHISSTSNPHSVTAGQAGADPSGAAAAAYGAAQTYADGVRTAHETAFSHALLHSNSMDHAQGTDQGLDTGGENQTTAAQVKSAVDLKHSSANDPSAGEKAALAGTSGTPGGTNKYVTDGDPRNADTRTPKAHQQAPATIDFAATARALGRNAAGAGVGEEVTASQILDWLGTAERGDVLYRGASSWLFLPHGTSGHVLTSGGHGADPSWAASTGTIDRTKNDFRLTLESGVPVSTTDQTAKDEVFLCPVSGGATTEGQMSLLGTDDTTWETHSFAQLSLKLTDDSLMGPTVNGSPVLSGLASTVGLVVGMEVSGTYIAAGSVIVSIDSATQVTMNNNATGNSEGVSHTFKCPASKNYDLFVVNIAGTPTLVFGPVWSSDSARGTDVIQKDGVPILDNAFVVGGVSYSKGRLRRVGGVGINAIAGQTEWVLGGTVNASFLIESENNRRVIPFFQTPAYSDNYANSSFAITSTTQAAANGGTANRVTWFGDKVSCGASLSAALANSNAAGQCFIGIGYDSETTSEAGITMAGTAVIAPVCGYAPVLPTGRHYLAITAWRNAYNGTWYADTSRYGGSKDPKMAGMWGFVEL